MVNSTALTDLQRTRRWKILANVQYKIWFYAILCLAAFLFGGLFQPGDWYLGLNKAWWTPPSIAFPIAWSILYIMIAFAGYCAAHAQSKWLIRLWHVQLAINALWSWLFFGEHWVLLALADLIVLLLLVITMITIALRQGAKKIAYLLLPYCLWLGLATSLNAYIVLYNSL